ncbi:MAG: hypothetical protein ACQEP2_08425, partial [Actinomycetota bacterium]
NMEKGEELSYEDLLYLISQAEEIDKKIIELLKKADKAEGKERDNYYKKIKELDSNISSIKNQIESFLEK